MRIGYALVAAAIFARGLAAQDAVVVVQHETTKDRPSQFKFHRPEDPSGTTFDGLPVRLHILEGQRVCFRVIQANPVLYAYALKITPVKVEAPDTVSQVVRAIALVLGTRTVTAGVGPDPVADYAATVADEYRNVIRMVDLRTASDKNSDFARSVANVTSAYRDSVLLFDKKADSMYAALPELARRSHTVQVSLALKAEILSRAKRINDEFTDGLAVSLRDLCERPKPGRSRIALAIAPNGMKTDAAARFVGDSVVGVDVDVERMSDFTVAVGAQANLMFKRYREFTAGADSVIRETKRSAYAAFAPMVFAGLRSPWTRGLDLRLGAGFTDYSKKLIDQFSIGLARRFGAVDGPSVDVSIGVGFTNRTIDTNSDVVVGTTKVQSGKVLNDYLDRGWVPGLAIGLAVKGF